jgi:hypothetical protein
MRQHLCLAFQIDFGIDVGGVDGDVTITVNCRKRTWPTSATISA